MSQVAVLFGREDSIYKAMPGCDVYDIKRDARTFPGGVPVVAHPPCRAWGRLRTFAKPRPDEKQLAIWAVAMVRKCGGVLEHPSYSTLWEAAGLPRPGQGRDEFGGFSLSVNQFWFGHKAEKSTWLYICGVEPGLMPALPLVFGHPAHVVCTSRRMRERHGVKELSKRLREATPPPAGRVAL